MKFLRGLWRFWPLVLLCSVAGAQAAEEYSFDASAFEKKPFELGGYVELKHEDFALNRSGAFYRLNNFGQPQRDDLGRTTGTLQLAGNGSRLIVPQAVVVRDGNRNARLCLALN